jgi:DivIVA domain-containing protein
MSDETTVLSADFPRSVRGYSTVAVDDFVRQIGDRLDSLQERLNDEVARADKLAEALITANSELVTFREKETALAGALVTMELQRGSVRNELEGQRNAASAEADALIDAAQSEAEAMLLTARTDAQGILAEAENLAEEIVQGARNECSSMESQIAELNREYSSTINEIRNTINKLSANLPGGAFLSGRSIDDLSIATVVEPANDLAHAA